MTQDEIWEMVQEAGFPSAYHHFEEGESPEPPFAVYLFPGTDNFAADGIVYLGINKLNIELYTDKKDPDAERKVEAVLKRHGFFYEKIEAYIESEKMYEVVYGMEVLVNGDEKEQG